MGILYLSFIAETHAYGDEQEEGTVTLTVLSFCSPTFCIFSTVLAQNPEKSSSSDGGLAVKQISYGFTSAPRMLAGVSSFVSSGRQFSLGSETNQRCSSVSQPLIGQQSIWKMDYDSGTGSLLTLNLLPCDFIILAARRHRPNPSELSQSAEDTGYSPSDVRLTTGHAR